jgi:hypothetical protein
MEEVHEQIIPLSLRESPTGARRGSNSISSSPLPLALPLRLLRLFAANHPSPKRSEDHAVLSAVGPAKEETPW